MEPFSHSAGYVPPLHRGAPSHLINVLIAVNDSEISLTHPKMKNEREKDHDGGRKNAGNVERVRCRETSFKCDYTSCMSALQGL